MVVPAKAGTHNHKCQLLGDAGTTNSFNKVRRGVWVPAPVRNCALGRDDVLEGAAGSHLSGAIPRTGIQYGAAFKHERREESDRIYRCDPT
ncbi:hypothetical protein ACVIIY_002696 [Bradyrhizobium sp. USDA 4515]